MSITKTISDMHGGRLPTMSKEFITDLDEYLKNGTKNQYDFMCGVISSVVATPNRGLYINNLIPDLFEWLNRYNIFAHISDEVVDEVVKSYGLPQIHINILWEYLPKRIADKILTIKIVNNPKWTVEDVMCNNYRSSDTFYYTKSELFGRWPDGSYTLGLGDVERNLEEAKAIHKFLGELLERAEAK